MEIAKAIIILLAGLGTFLIGFKLMSENIEKLSASGLKKLFKKTSKSRFAGLGIGALITAILQSSTATTVMIVGFVNASYLSLMQATAMIMGANIGSTVTAQIASLNNLPIGIFAMGLTFIGVIMSIIIKKDKVKTLGLFLSGLGLIFIAMYLMKSAFGSESFNKIVENVFSNVSNPLLLLFIGALVTVMLQSSGAATTIIISMISAGLMVGSNSNSVLFIILGSNIGTCVTPLLSSMGAGTNAKRAAFIHLFFNLFGSLVFFVILLIWKDFMDQTFYNWFSNKASAIAMFHTFFNVSVSLLLLPFIKYIVKFVELIIKDKKNGEHLLKYIDDLLIKTPNLALGQVKKEIENMALIAKNNLNLAFVEIRKQDCECKELVAKNEALLDYLNNAITEFLIKLAPSINQHGEHELGSYFHVVNDIERIGDHAQNFMDLAVEMKEKNLKFSAEANDELDMMYAKIVSMYDIALKAFSKITKEDLALLDSLECDTDNLKEQLSASHFERLAKENCTIELGSYFTTIIAALERIGDHLVNVGYSVKNPTGDQVVQQN